MKLLIHRYYHIVLHCCINPCPNSCLNLRLHLCHNPRSNRHPKRAQNLPKSVPKLVAKLVLKPVPKTMFEPMPEPDTYATCSPCISPVHLVLFGPFHASSIWFRLIRSKLGLSSLNTNFFFSCSPCFRSSL